MNYLKIELTAAALLIFSLARSQQISVDFPKLSDHYLGQKPPGLIPELFAPGIISTDQYELNSIFSKDGTEFYYCISTTTKEEKAEGIYFYKVMFTKLVNGYWTKPERTPFSGENMTVDISFSPDGNRLFYCTDKLVSEESEGLDIWYVERNGSGWSDPVSLGSPINSTFGETQPTFTDDGTIYFPSAREGTGADIYYSKLVAGSYDEPVKLSGSINTEYGEGNSFIAPDESYILFARWGMPEEMYGGKGLFISFRKDDDTWTEARHIEEETGMCGSLAALSPDGKYLFYSCDGDIFWVDAGVVNKLK